MKKEKGQGQGQGQEAGIVTGTGAAAGTATALVLVPSDPNLPEEKVTVSSKTKVTGIRFWRFMKGDQVIATLDTTGRLLIRDSEGGLEKWSDLGGAGGYFEQVMKMSKPKAHEDVLAELTKTLGDVVTVADEDVAKGNKKTPLSPNPSAAQIAETSKGKGKEKEEETEEEEEGTFDMKNVKKNNVMGGAAKKATPAKKTAAAAAKAKHAPRTPKEVVDKGPLPKCKCGCGDEVGKHTSTFLPGHDARFHGWLKKIDDGRLQYKDLPSDEARKAVKKAIASGELKALKH